MSKTLVLTFLLALAPTIAFALPSDVEAELQSHIKIFKGSDTFRQKQVAQTLEWSGLSQASLFDLVEKKLVDAYDTASDKQQVDYLAWLSKALAFSGNPKYRSTLEMVAADAKHGKLRKYAKKSLPTLTQHQRWNDQIIDEANWNPQLSADINRFTAMIQSDVLELKRMAAKRVHYEHIYNEPLLDLFEQQLLANYQADNKDKVYVDSWAWVCKALAGSRNLKYKASIEKVANEAPNKKLRKYAKKYLKYYNS